jgi:hypothetical protein
MRVKALRNADHHRKRRKRRVIRCQPKTLAIPANPLTSPSLERVTARKAREEAPQKGSLGTRKMTLMMTLPHPVLPMTPPRGQSPRILQVTPTILPWTIHPHHLPPPALTLLRNDAEGEGSTAVRRNTAKRSAGRKSTTIKRRGALLFLISTKTRTRQWATPSISTECLSMEARSTEKLHQT